jgi:hypothetical protein
MSYDGRMDFGLVGDFDVMYDLDDLATDLYDSLAELAEAAGRKLTSAPPDAPAEDLQASDVVARST